MKIKEKLYRTAALLFEKKGYPATSVRDIAEAMQLKPSSLYSHIRHKEEILISICDLVASRFERAIADVVSQDITPLEQLKKVIDFHVQMAFEDPVSITVFNNEWRHLPSEELSIFVQRRKEYEAKLSGILAALGRSHALRPIAHHFILQTMLSSMLWLHRSFPKHAEGGLSEIQQSMKIFILKGILL